MTGADTGEVAADNVAAGVEVYRASATVSAE